jgi:methionine-rich copper-binding protein CopC
MNRLVLALVLVLAAAPAFAHAHLLKSVPVRGAKTRPPRHVVLTFSEALEPAFSGALLMDADGRNLTGAPVKIDGPVITLTPDRLAPGRYQVTWHAVGHDTHRTDGSFTFTVAR